MNAAQFAPNAHRLTAALFASLALVVAASCYAKPRPSRLFPNPINFDNNNVLFKFLVKNDPVLSRIAGRCSNLHVSRRRFNMQNHFDITGFCLTKDIPPEDLDCAGYDIVANGTIDDPIQATVRKLSLTLVCGDEGRSASGKRQAK